MVLILLKTVQEIVEELAEGHKRPFEAFGRTWEGDIWYSDIYRFVKNHIPKRQHDSAYSEICKQLETRGFYIHS